MFGLFKKSSSPIPVIDKIWMTEEAKWRACTAMLAADTSCTLLCWFIETQEQLLQRIPLENHSRILMAESVSQEHVHNRMIVFVEHYPLEGVEQTLFASLNLKNVPVLSSLGDSFFMKFGGQKTIDLMKQMGMKEDEAIGHNMITRSIKRAQGKIAAKVRAERKANSQAEWFAINNC